MDLSGVICRTRDILRVFKQSIYCKMQLKTVLLFALQLLKSSCGLLCVYCRYMLLQLDFNLL